MWTGSWRSRPTPPGRRWLTLPPTQLRRYLATRFGVAVDHFDAALQPLDLPTLTALSEAAFETDSLADFEKTLTTFTPPPYTAP